MGPHPPFLGSPPFDVLHSALDLNPFRPGTRLLHGPHRRQQHPRRRYGQQTLSHLRRALHGRPSPRAREQLKVHDAITRVHDRWTRRVCSRFISGTEISRDF
jgi:hypothetical protein